MAIHRKLKKSYLEAIADMASRAWSTVTAEQTATNGTISVSNGDGTTTVIGAGAGTDETGASNGTAYFVGDTTPPSAPTGISFIALDGSITGIWDGTLTDGVPADFNRIVFRADGSQFGTVNTAGSASSDAFETGTTYSCDAVAVDVQGNVSDPCDAVDVTVRNLAAEADALAEEAQTLAEEAQETAASAEEAAAAAKTAADAASESASALADSITDIETTVTDLSTTVAATATTATEALELATSVETSLEGFEVTVSETYATKTELADVEDTADSAATDAASALEQVSTLSVTVEGVSATASSAYTTANTALTNAAAAQATADAITTKVESDYTTTADLTEMLGSYVTDTTLSATLESYSTTEQTAEAITSAVSSALYTTDTDGNTTAIYATTSEVEQTATEILSTVSSTYATTDSLSSYATTSYVDQQDDAIELAVASTYATKGELEEVDEKADAANATAESAYAAATALLGTCATAASTAAKVVTCDDFALFDGAAIAVTFTYANTAGAITLNVNGTGALSVYVSGGTASTSNYILWSAGTTVEFVYDGTYWLYAGGATSYKVTCGTAAATAAKTATQAGAVVCKGTNAVVTWTYGSSYEGAITFNLGSTAAKTVYYGNAATSSTNVLDINATETFELVFSGAYWYVADSASLTRNATLAVTVDEIDASVSEVYETTGYTLAEIADLAITAESITSTVSSTYATVDSLSDYATTEYVDDAVSTATTTITAAYTSAIEQSAESITSTVSATYLTSSDAAATYATQSSLEQTTGDITAMFSSYATVEDLEDVSDTASTAYSNSAYGTCSTAASTQAKVVTCSDFTRSTGSTVTVAFTYANTYVSGATTLNVNSTGAASIYAVGAVTSTSNQILWGAGARITFTYDGTYWRVADTAPVYSVASSTAASTTAKTASQTAALIIKGTTANVTFTNGNTASAPTFNLASTVADSIYTGSTVVSSSNPLMLNSGTVLSLVWNGSYWKVADTYYSTIIRQSSDGIEVGKIEAGSYTTTRTLMDDEGFHVLDSDGTELSSFTSDTVELNEGTLAITSNDGYVDITATGTSANINPCITLTTDATYNPYIMLASSSTNASSIKLSSYNFVVYGSDSSHIGTTDNFVGILNRWAGSTVTSEDSSTWTGTWHVIDLGGVVMCTYVGYYGNVKVTDASGNVYISTENISLPDYPVTFTSYPALSIEYLYGDSGYSGSAWVTLASNDSSYSPSTNPGPIVFYASTSRTLGHPRVSIIAVGVTS